MLIYPRRMERRPRKPLGQGAVTNTSMLRKYTGVHVNVQRRRDEYQSSFRVFTATTSSSRELPSGLTQRNSPGLTA
eukprot:2212928-Pyramimonas_sp.AAC.2